MAYWSAMRSTPPRLSAVVNCVKRRFCVSRDDSSRSFASENLPSTKSIVKLNSIVELSKHSNHRRDRTNYHMYATSKGIRRNDPKKWSANGSTSRDRSNSKRDCNSIVTTRPHLQFEAEKQEWESNRKPPVSSDSLINEIAPKYAWERSIALWKSLSRKASSMRLISPLLLVLLFLLCSSSLCNNDDCLLKEVITPLRLWLVVVIIVATVVEVIFSLYLLSNPTTTTTTTTMFTNLPFYF